MRFDSADSASDFSLCRSVTRKRLVVSSRCPTTSSEAAAISWIHMPALTISP